MIIDILDKFERWVLTPSEKIINNIENHYNVFIILSVAIDNLANIRYLGEIPDSPEKSKLGIRYRKFIKNYMPDEYKKYTQHLYEDFRCQIIHKFQLKYFDLQQNERSVKLHLTKLKTGRVCLNSRRLHEDVRTEKEQKKGQSDLNISAIFYFSLNFERTPWGYMYIV